MKEYIQPFERQLALEELGTLAEGPITPLDGDNGSAMAFSIPHTNDAETLRSSLAYWHSIGHESEGLTRQLRNEATHNIARFQTGIVEAVAEVDDLVLSNLPNRRTLRYATHGLHEYRGKFFPQMIRAMMNIAKVPENGIVLDPMVGSGTTLVEARLSGFNAYGLDMNPLAVFISKVKCGALEFSPAQLGEAWQALARSVDQPIVPNDYENVDETIQDDDRSYLGSWFSGQAILELDHILGAIRSLPLAPLQNFFLMSFSNILRQVSQQKTDDLRSRREKNDLLPGETLELFLRESRDATRTVMAFLAASDPASLGDYFVLDGDALQTTRAFPELLGRVDAIITSPPYATALPYIDTDRLSLIYLGLLPRDCHRSRDRLMIGNREISNRERKAYLKHYRDNACYLPTATRALVERIHGLNESANVGFRRKNLSALLSKYFFDMREVLRQCYTMLRPGGSMFLVVGNNQTTAGTEKISINTPNHLESIAAGIGFETIRNMPMEMLLSRDIFKENAVPSENILQFEKPQ